MGGAADPFFNGFYEMRPLKKDPNTIQMMGWQGSGIVAELRFFKNPRDFKAPDIAFSWVMCHVRDDQWGPGCMRSMGTWMINDFRKNRFGTCAYSMIDSSASQTQIVPEVPPVGKWVLGEFRNFDLYNKEESGIRVIANFGDEL